MIGNDADRLARLSSFLHALSHLALIFVPAAVYFQIRAFRAVFWSARPDHAVFVSGFLVSLSLWGFFMALQSLADSRRMSPAAIARARRAQKLVRRMSWVTAFAALGTVALGIGLLLLAGDELQGVAITCFGVGLLGVTRSQIDRLSSVLATAAPPPPEEAEPSPPPHVTETT